MNTDFTIKNFRIFDHDGTNVPLRPITILTGCNNAGKSSIVKALCLLKDFCKQLEADFENGKRLHLAQYMMDFHKSPNNIMGSFDLVRHHATKKEETEEKKTVSGEPIESLENNRITFEFIVESSWILQEVILHLEFGSLDWDDLNNGYLQAYSIKTLDGKVIYKDERDGKASADFSIVKKSLLHFLYAQYAFSKWQSEVTYRQIELIEVPEDEDKDAKLFDETLFNAYEDLGSKAIDYLLEWQVSHCYRPWKDGRRGHRKNIINKIADKSFAIYSPKLDVFCFFPCLQFFKDMKKNEIIQEINNVIKTKDKPISSLDQKIINLLLDAFKESEENYLHEFISNRENERYFIDHDVQKFQDDSFADPAHIHMMAAVGASPFDEQNLPDKADWDVILVAMDLINKLITRSSISFVDFDDYSGWYYDTEGSISGFLKNIVEDVFANLIPGSLSYSPTTIVYPRRLYSLEESNDFALTLRKYFDTKRFFYEEKDTSSFGRFIQLGKKNRPDEEYKGYKPCQFIDKWLNILGIANHVEVKSHVDGKGVTIQLYKDENDIKGMQLIDKGFGVLQLFAVLLKIEIAILEMKTNEELYRYDTTGLNSDAIKDLRTHSQLHPVTVALEEPECHLHPSLQSKFAEIIVEANQEYGVNFIVESHSEYFIRKLQLLVSQKKISNEDVSLLYINPIDRPAYIPVITDIGLESNGVLKHEFGPGFFDESLRLSKELFKPKAEEHEEQS